MRGPQVMNVSVRRWRYVFVECPKLPVCVCSVSAVCACVRLSTRCHKLLLKAAHQL